MKIKNIIITTVILCCSVFCLSAEVTMEEAKKVLQLAENNTAYMGTDFKADYSIVTDTPGSGKSVMTAVMYRRDSKGMFLIRILSPDADKGKGYVQFDSTIWYFDPKDKQFTYSSSKSKFNNTNINNSDLVPQIYVKNYKIDAFKEVVLGKFNCIYYELTATTKNVDYPILKLWVSKDDGLIRKKEDYSLSKQLLRTTAIPSYQKINGKNIPVGMLLVDNLRGTKIDGKVQYEKTQVSITNVSFQAQPNTIYSKQYLETMSDQ